MSNTLLALDQSSRCSGWSVFVDGKLESFGKINAEQNDMGERLFYIRQEIKNLLDIYQPDMVLMEDIQLQSNVMNNVQTFKILAEVFGVIEELLSEEEYPHDAVLASSWKSTLGIKGRNRAEQKRNAQQYVVNTYGINVIQDIADSVCIATHYLKKQNENKKIPRAGVDWS